MGDVRGPHRAVLFSRERRPGLDEFSAPDPCPGQARQSEKHEEDGDPCARRRVKRFPEAAAPARKVGHQRAPAHFRQPHVKPRGDEQQHQRDRRFDQPVPRVADHERAVDLVGIGVKRFRLVDLVQHLASVGIYGNRDHRIGVTDCEEGRSVDALWRDILVQNAIRNGCQRGLGLSRDRQRAFAHGDVGDIAHLVGLARGQQHDHAGDRQRHDEGDDKKPGIEMPAPGGEVQRVAPRRCLLVAWCHNLSFPGQGMMRLVLAGCSSGQGSERRGSDRKSSSVRLSRKAMMSSISASVAVKPAIMPSFIGWPGARPAVA